MPRYAMWVHGTSVHQDIQGFHVNELRAGWGTEFQSTGHSWFQVAIPTPVLIADQRATLEKIFVLYKAERGARLMEVHIWDGGDQGQCWNNLGLAGDHGTVLDPANSWFVNPVSLKWGLGLAIGVDFGASSLAGVPKITFFAAGADFLVP